MQVTGYKLPVSEAEKEVAGAKKEVAACWLPVSESNEKKHNIYNKPQIA